MSTSWLYHGFGVRGYRYVKTEYVWGGMVITMERPWQACRCVACGSENVWRHGWVVRRFRTVPIGRREVFLKARIPRLACQACGAVRQAALGFADARRTYTKSFERYALELSRHMTIKAVAMHLGVSWDVIKDIQKRYLHRRFSRPKLKPLRQIAIDEISTGKGHQYVTIVMDLETGAVALPSVAGHAPEEGPQGRPLVALETAGTPRRLSP